MILNEKHAGNNHETINEVDEELVLAPAWQDHLQKTAVRVSSTELGQFAIRHGDRVLYTIEKTAKWSCPEEKKSSLVRPLPWLIFLPALVALRSTRIALSIGSFLIGYDWIDATDFVSHIQTCRRKVRAIKYQGLRMIRLRNQEAGVRALGSDSRDIDTGKLQKMLTQLMRVVCVPKPLDDGSVRVRVRKEKKSKNALEVDENKSRKRDRSNSEDDSDSDAELRKIMNDAFVDSDSDDEDYVLDSGAESESDSDISDDGEEELSGLEVAAEQKDKNVKENKKQTDESAKNDAPKTEYKNTNNHNNEVAANGLNGENKQLSENEHHNNAHKHQNGSLSEDSKISNHSESHEQNKELKRNDSAPLQNYTNSIGDGVNDDTFYSPIGSPTPENEIGGVNTSADDTHNSIDRDYKPNGNGQIPNNHSDTQSQQPKNFNHSTNSYHKTGYNNSRYNNRKNRQSQNGTNAAAHAGAYNSANGGNQSNVAHGNQQEQQVTNKNSKRN